MWLKKFVVRVADRAGKMGSKSEDSSIYQNFEYESFVYVYFSQICCLV